MSVRRVANVSSSLVLLFHVSAFALLVYTVHWQFGLKAPGPRDSPKPVGGHLIFLTVDGLVLVCVYFALALMADVFPRTWLSTLRDAVFFLVLPFALIIAILFWGLYMADPHFLFPTGPQAGSRTALFWEMVYVEHGGTAVLCLVEMVLYSHRTSDTKSTVFRTLGTGSLYLAWNAVARYVNGWWPYPFQRHMTLWHHILFDTIALGIAVAVALGCVYVNQRLWRSITKKKA